MAETPIPSKEGGRIVEEEKREEGEGEEDSEGKTSWISARIFRG